MANAYYQDPARYFQTEQTRRDQQIRSMLNLFMQMQQMKQQRKQWGARQEMEKRRMGYTEPYMRAQTERMLRPEPTLEEQMREKAGIIGVEATTRAEIKKRYAKSLEEQAREKKELAKATAEGRRLGAPPIPPKPSAYEIRKRDLDKARKIGDITDDQYHQSLFGLKQSLTPEEKLRKGASIRDGNARELKDFYTSISDLIDKGRIKSKELRKMSEDRGGGRPTSQQGYALDMPEKYIRAKLNKRDGVATPEDEENINKYNAMFRYFREQALQIAPTFKDWLKTPEAKSPKFDRLQMKIWYEIYKQ